jgi:hypothetical protein
MRIVEAHQPAAGPIVQSQRVGQTVRAGLRHIRPPDNKSHDMRLVVNYEHLAVKIQKRIQRPVASGHSL